jgi:hypothetical protein
MSRTDASASRWPTPRSKVYSPRILGEPEPARTASPLSGWLRATQTCQRQLGPAAPAWPVSSRPRRRRARGVGVGARTPRSVRHSTKESAGDDAGGFFERASARATNDLVELVFRPRRRLPRIADTSVAHMTYRGAMTKPSLPAVRGNDLDPSHTSPGLWCQHAKFIHAYDGPCLFSGCGCPFFTPAEPDVIALW